MDSSSLVSAHFKISLLRNHNTKSYLLRDPISGFMHDGKHIPFIAFLKRAPGRFQFFSQYEEFGLSPANTLFDHKFQR